MIRILHVLHGMNCGGAENMIMNLYRRIDRTKIQFDFLVHTEKKCFFDDEISQLGGNIYRVPYFKLINIIEYRKSLSVFFRNHPEIKVVHGHVGSCAHIYLQIAKKYGKYTIAHSHSAGLKKITPKNLVFRLFSIKTRYIADFFFGCSKAAGIDRYGKNISQSNSFKILNNAIDTDKYKFSQNICDKIRNEFNVRDKLVIGHIGRFNEVKNHKYLIEIFKKISDKRPDSMLMMVGDGELRPEIENQIKELKIADKVIMTGVRSDVNELLQSMDCFVFPSFYEGLGIVIIEAECFGIPCFINETLPHELYINENIYGISLKKTPEEWAEIILNNADSKVSANEARNNIIKAGYDIEETAKTLEDFYLSHVK